jgi:hypothetical protein
MGLFDDACRPAKNDPAVRALTLSLPRPRPPPDKGPKEKPSTTHPKRPPHQISSLPVRCPKDRPHGQSPSTNPVQRTPAKGFTPRTRNRPCVSAVKNTNLKLSLHRTGTTTVERPHQNVTYVIRESCPHQGSSSTKRARASIPTPIATATRAPHNGPGLSFLPSTGLRKNARGHPSKDH